VLIVEDEFSHRMPKQAILVAANTDSSTLARAESIEPV